MTVDSEDRLLEVEDLVVHVGWSGQPVPVVDRVSLRVERGEPVGLVGESGCGKSLTALALARLLPEPSAGSDGMSGSGRRPNCAPGGAAASLMFFRNPWRL